MSNKQIIDEVISNWPGQDNPKEKLKAGINPKAHGFNKASRKKDPITWVGK